MIRRLLLRLVPDRLLIRWGIVGERNDGESDL